MPTFFPERMGLVCRPGVFLGQGCAEGGPNEWCGLCIHFQWTHPDPNHWSREVLGMHPLCCEGNRLSGDPHDARCPRHRHLLHFCGACWQSTSHGFIWCPSARKLPGRDTSRAGPPVLRRRAADNMLDRLIARIDRRWQAFARHRSQSRGRGV